MLWLTPVGLHARYKAGRNDTHIDVTGFNSTMA
jgi:hypothetical protein